jgi:hypothetical protein
MATVSQDTSLDEMGGEAAEEEEVDVPGNDRRKNCIIM